MKSKRQIFKYLIYAALVLAPAFFILTYTSKEIYECNGLVTDKNGEKVDRRAYVKTEDWPFITAFWRDMKGYLYFELLSNRRNYLEYVSVFDLKEDDFYSVGAIYKDQEKSGGFQNNFIIKTIEINFGDQKTRYSGTCLPLSKKT